MIRSVVVALSIVTALVLAVPAHAAEGDAEDSKVTFVHGIRGFFADVYLDDELILEGFAPERVTEPLQLEPGEHRIDLRAADAPADAKPDVTKTFRVRAGAQNTAIAHWTGEEDCTITLFDDAGDLAKAGSGKLIARHAAAIGEVDFSLDEVSGNRPLSPNGQVVRSVDPGEHTVTVSGNGRTIKSSQVPVPEGSARVVYLVGSAKDRTLGLLTQTVDGLQSDPTGVPTGNSGLKAETGAPAAPMVPVALLAVAVVAFAVAGRSWRVARRG